MREEVRTAREPELTWDVAEHLGQRLGMSCERAKHLLADWVAEYEPEIRRQIAICSLAEQSAKPRYTWR
jgi:hypothetical protein